MIISFLDLAPQVFSNRLGGLKRFIEINAREALLCPFLRVLCPCVLHGASSGIAGGRLGDVLGGNLIEALEKIHIRQRACCMASKRFFECMILGVDVLDQLADSQLLRFFHGYASIFKDYLNIADQF